MTFSIFAVAIALAGMAWIFITIVKNGFSVIDLSFLTNPSKPYGVAESGIANALLGTLYITAGATIMAVPLALAAGIYLSEYGKGSRLCNYLRFCANVLMGLPSILIGLFVYIILVVPMGKFSGMAGSVALALIMFPVIMRCTEDMLSMVPYTLRESALALGMTRMRTTLCIIFRAAKNGLATGVLLSLARVSGETAPLIFTAMFVNAWPDNYFSHATANMPILINEYTMNSPFESMHAAGWGAALVITCAILIINITARYVFRDKHANK